MGYPNNTGDWYFFVDGNQTQVFHTGRGIFVPVADAAYIAWLGQPDHETTGVSLASLGVALAQFSIRPTEPTVLDSYTGVQAAGILKHAAFKIVFNHENRLRAIERALSLNGSPANLTAGQASAVVKGLM